MTPTDLREWQAAIQQAPLKPRMPLWLHGAQVGSVEESVLQQLALTAPDVWEHCFQKTERPDQDGYAFKAVVGQDTDATLAAVASALQRCGASGAWRNELLPVLNHQGEALARVERAVVRVLGMRTRAVHLVGQRPDGSVWLQLRSFNKPNDPGLWDTLMGGTVAAGETVTQTLQRETWEEAGLNLNELPHLTQGGHFTATRPVPDGGNTGYLVEDTDWYTATVPEHLTPSNLDGEVDHFELWSIGQVFEGLSAEAFTAEARWVLAQALSSHR